MQHIKSRRMRFVWVVITAAVLQSCGASWHLKRAIAKDPTIMNDTIVKVDTTFVTDEIRLTDTLVVRDTIIREIKRDGVVVRFQRLLDTIVVDATCLSDTIELIHEVPVYRIVYKQNDRSVYYDRAIGFLYIVMAILIIWLVIKLIR